MKSLKEIEDISLEQLEAVSQDEAIAVPEGFRQRLEAELDAQNKLETMKEEPRKIRLVPVIGVAASVLLLIGIGLGIARWQSEPKDTFTDPYLAYAELEKAFSTMSEGMNKALAMADKSETIIDRATSVFSEE
ncbi:MAG: hypothetical protein IKV91_06665 [Bacteroidales bacterium]|nr:hypothetical protein [Bacteroidales bacterium]